MNQGVLQTYHDFLPLTSTTPMISLGEGGTPLVRSHRMAAGTWARAALLQAGGL